MMLGQEAERMMENDKACKHGDCEKLALFDEDCSLGKRALHCQQPTTWAGWEARPTLLTLSRERGYIGETF